MKRLNLIFFMLFFHGSIYGQWHVGNFSKSQPNIFEWRSGMCGYSGEYDTTKYTQRQIIDTYTFCYDFPSMSDRPIGFIPFRPSQIDSLSVRRLTKLYKRALKKLKNFTLVNSVFWEEQRENEANSLRESYQFDKLTIKAYKKPALLKEYKNADTCSKYIPFLIAGGDSLLTEWKYFMMEHCKHNGNPEWCVDEYYNKLFNTSDKLKWARIALMSFGWYNCNAYTRKYYKQDGLMQKEFISLFFNFKYGCAE
jgi:hypothetical protein